MTAQPSTLFKVETECRLCATPLPEPFLDLGAMPLADRLVRSDQLALEDWRVPLTVSLCPACSLVQIRETVLPEVLFGADYPYFSSISPSLMRHFQASAEAIIASRSLDADSWVVEAACNDGYLLRHFHQRGIPVLGIDPAGPAMAAQAQGIAVLNTFFSRTLARQLREQHPEGADVFLANNVLAHVADLNGFVEGIATLLKPTGVAVIEAPYLVDLVNHCEFDTIYHQHLCYFSVTALTQLFRRHGLYLNDVERTAIHGGSLRLFVEPQEKPSPRLNELLADEERLGLRLPDYYQRLSRQVESIRSGLTSMLRDLHAQGYRLAGYGAAAKATTLLNYLGLEPGILDYVADQNPVKHGQYLPGVRLPIVPTTRLQEDPPDYLVILAWNFAEEIMAQQQDFQRQGGRFIVPIPHPRIV